MTASAGTGLVVGASLLAIGVLAGVLLAWRWGVRKADEVDAANALDCGCPRDGKPIYGCITCGDERCYVHQNGLCGCDERVTTHERDPEAAETDAHFAGDWALWAQEMKEKAE